MKRILTATIIGLCLAIILIVSSKALNTAAQQSPPTSQWVTSGTSRVPIYRMDAEDKLTLVRADVIVDGTVLKPTFVFTSQKTILACGFVLELYSDKGYLFRKEFAIDAVLIPDRPPILPSDNITVNFTDVQLGGVPERIEVKVDYVEFADRSFSGQNTRRFRETINAERRGALRILQYLRGEYLKHGAPALEKILAVK